MSSQKLGKTLHSRVAKVKYLTQWSITIWNQQNFYKEMVLISLGALELFVEHIDIVFHKFMVVISSPMYTDQLICYMLFLTV